MEKLVKDDELYGVEYLASMAFFALSLDHVPWPLD
jgi:hypothetical protein